MRKYCRNNIDWGYIIDNVLFYIVFAVLIAGALFSLFAIVCLLVLPNLI